MHEWAWWIDPSRDWWLRHNHALGHLGRLRTEIDHYKARRPISAVRELGRKADEVQFRLRLNEPVPPVVGLLAGDILHSLRASLDNLAFAMVEAEHGRLDNEKEARRVQFPIEPSPASFDKFFDEDRIRKRLMGGRIRGALRSVQPFHWLSEAKSLGVAGVADLSYEDQSEHETLSLLGKLSNLDKHRRLAATSWWPSLVYWGSDGQTDAHWRPTMPPPWNDGDIIAYMRSDGELQSDVVHEFNVVLLDLVNQEFEFFRSSDLANDAAQWCQGVQFTMHNLLRQFVP